MIRSRRNLLKLLGLLPFSSLMKLKGFARLKGTPRYPTLRDYDSIDGEIKSYLTKKFGVDQWNGTAKYLRELVQLYSRVYAKDEHHFHIYANKFLAFREQSVNSPKEQIYSIDWRQIKQITDDSAESLGVGVWYADYTKREYDLLDAHLQKRLGEHRGIEIDTCSVHYVRQWAQCHHFIYRNSQTAVSSFSHYPQYQSALGALNRKPLKVDNVTVKSADVVEWIRDWERA
jgi:hypothetical protein